MAWWNRVEGERERVKSLKAQLAQAEQDVSVAEIEDKVKALTVLKKIVDEYKFDDDQLELFLIGLVSDLITEAMHDLPRKPAERKAK